jgi:hypothetical protein
MAHSASTHYVPSPIRKVDNTIQLSSCCTCSGRFSYYLSSGGTVKILVGIPSHGLTYKAMSHVWGHTLLLTCIVKVAQPSIRFVYGAKLHSKTS